MVECGQDGKRGPPRRRAPGIAQTRRWLGDRLSQVPVPARAIFWHNGTVPSTPHGSHHEPHGDARHGATAPPTPIPAVVPLLFTAGAVAWAGAVTLSDFSPAWPGVALAVAGFLVGQRVAHPLLRGGIRFAAVAACIALLVQISAVVGAAWAIKDL